MLQANEIVKAFDKKTVLSGVSFSLHPGEITALVGRNGSGKTTLLRILSRIIDAEQGTICINEKDVITHPELMENIAFLPDRFDYFPFDSGNRIMDYYQMIYPHFDRRFVEAEALKLGLDLKATSRSLSKGNKVLLGLIIVIATGTPYLLVDELLDGIDVLNKKKIKQYLLDVAESGRAVLISSHQLEELQGIADRILYLTMDGQLEETTGEDGNTIKVQVVVKDALPASLQRKSVEVFQMGRVHTLLLEGPLSSVLAEINGPEIVQYDILPVKLEDYFYWEQGKEKINA